VSDGQATASDSFVLSVVTPPPNDDFDSPVIITTLPYAHTQTTAGAGVAPDEPVPSCGPGALVATVWYRYTASSTGTVRFDTTGSSYDTVLLAYTGTRGNLTEVACNDDSGGGLQSRIDLPVTAGTTYHIVVDGFAGATGTLMLSASQPQPGPELHFTPTDDALVKSDSPTNNYGTRTYLQLRGVSSPLYNSYLKFTVSGLTGSVQRATLRLYAYDGSDSAGSVYAVSNTYQGSTTPWTESGITWNTAPVLSGTPLSTPGGSVPNNSWVEYDVTAAVTGNGTFSFGLSTPSSNSLYTYSKEAASNRPELVIQFGMTSVETRSEVSARGCFEETNLAWTWQGLWLPYFQVNASGGALMSYVSEQPGPDVFAEFSFAAEGFGLVYHRSPSGGIADVFIDDMTTPYTQIDMYADSDQGLDDAVLPVEGLDPAVVHTVRIVPTGEKNLLSGGYAIYIDRIDLPAYSVACP
jgi:hypothetical protein